MTIHHVSRPSAVASHPGTQVWMRDDRGTMNSMTGRSAQIELTMPADTSALGGLRLQLAMDASDSGVDLDVVEELVLVASELVSNVIRHTDEVDMTIRLRAVGSGWILDVSGADSMDHLPGAGGMPDPMQQGGRGLVIVRAMMDGVDLVDEGGRRWVRCHKRC